MTLKFAFEGERDHLRFVSSRPAGIQQGGLSLVGLAVETDDRTRTRNLVMRRAQPDDEAKDFGPLDKPAQASILVAGIDSVDFSYFGNESDFADPKWTDHWEYPNRIPMLIRLRMKSSDGTPVPEMVVRITLSEEAGCLESTFQRICRPRRG
jgi:hypothetical protein